MKKYIMLLFVLVFMSGCKSTVGYRQQLEARMGTHVDSLISMLGPPQSSYPLSTGGQVLEWYKEETREISAVKWQVPKTTYNTSNTNIYGSGKSIYGNTYGTTTTYEEKEIVPAHTVKDSCLTRITTDKYGYIIANHFEGNDCRAEAPK